MSSALIRQLQRAEKLLRDNDAAGAESTCLQVLRKAPRNPDALYLLGMALLSQRRSEQAVGVLEQVVAVDPRHGAALENLGLAQLFLGRFAAAEQSLQRASVMSGVPASVFMRLGIAMLEQGRAHEAVVPLRRALALAPDDPDCHLNLGRAFGTLDDSARATECFRSAQRLAPQRPEAAYNLGVIAMQHYQLAEARDWFEQAIARAPAYVAAREGLASISLSLGRTSEAIDHLQAALRAEPGNATACAALAGALFQSGELDAARSTAERTLRLEPSNASAYATRANVHLVRDELAQAIPVLEQGYSNTGSSVLLGMLTYQLRQACDWQKWHTAWAKMVSLLDSDAALGSPFWLLCEPTSASQQLIYTRRWAAARFGPARRAHRGPAIASAPRRTKIGYLSSDLHDHATAHLMADVLEHHDRTRFEIFAYSYGPDDGSTMRQRLRSACEHFVDIAREPDDVAAERIRADALDILVDLKGYTLGDRLTIMAHRPCAIQATWLGYPGTTGASFIDYLIADPIVVPEGAEANYSERIVRLAQCYQPNDRARAVAAPASRVDYGLPPEGFVLCCFNQTYKITPDVFAVWMRLLNRVPGSVLWLLESNALAKQNLRQAATREGIDEQRLVFAPRMPNDEHLARYRVADLALDTFPYTSHTTMSDALWCGCAAIGLAGETFASRVSASVLTAAGMSDLVVHSLDDYERLALALAGDRDRLREVRDRIAVARDHSPLFDSRMFARALEALYSELAMRE